jgi:PAS domain S-box-containing protein
MVDLEGNIAFANNFLCDMLGREPQQLTGRSCFDLICSEDWPKAKVLFNGQQEGVPPRNF